MSQPRVSDEQLLAVYEKNAGSVAATTKELGYAYGNRDRVAKRLIRLGALKKPLVAGSVTGREARSASLPARGKVKRYILTSAQNNTKVQAKVWESLQTLAKYYHAEILIGTYSYDPNRFGKLSVKRGKKKEHQTELWYAPELKDYFSDERLELATGLVWCGEMNILPTAVNPLAGMESYTARKSAIFPHAKMSMRSVPTMQSEGTKLNYTTGTVTQRNYIKKREGLVAEHHHVYGGLLVEVNHEGNWWVRQLNASNDGTIYDLDVKIVDGKVTTDHQVEAINWGDIHACMADESVVKASLSMLDFLEPKFQFMHDVMEGTGTNHHNNDNPHFKFYAWMRGLHKFEAELQSTYLLLERYDRPQTKTVVVHSNHDDQWVQQWLREFDYRKDPGNAELFLKAQSYMYGQLRKGKLPRDVNVLEWCLREVGYKSKAQFLLADESFLICNNKIECGMHGHLGPNGTWGSPTNLAAMGRKANTGHTHSAGIYNGLYVAGTSSALRWDYNHGPSSWTHSHIVTYPNGKRSIVTIYKGKWRA